MNSILYEMVFAQVVAEGRQYDSYYATNCAATDRIDSMTNTELLSRISDALDEMLRGRA